MPGIASRNVWVMDMEIIKMPIKSNETYCNRRGATLTTIIETRLIWMPGVSPVKIPTRTPTTMARRS